jgi:hypothetical protein
MRDALMQLVPDAASEFSLTCEMSFLFRMLATAAQGTVCQAANLLRALRQNKEAAGLGLLEGVKGERGAGDIEVWAACVVPCVAPACSLHFVLCTALQRIALQPLCAGSAACGAGAVTAVTATTRWLLTSGRRHLRPTLQVEAKKDRSLSRRVQSLSRFLLEALNKEGSAGVLLVWQCGWCAWLGRARCGPASAGRGVAVLALRDAPLKAPCRCHSGLPATALPACAGGRQSAVDSVYCLVQRQRTQCLSRPNRPDQVKETRIFQMDLLYPPAKDRPAGGSNGGGPGAPPPGSAPNSPDAKAGTRVAAAAAAAAAAGSTASRDASGRPSFAGLLQQSLKVQSEMRAWFDEEVSRHSRVDSHRSLPCHPSSPSSTASPCLPWACMHLTRVYVPFLTVPVSDLVHLSSFFFEQVKYQYVRQTRVPKSLPQVLVVNCGLQASLAHCFCAAAAAAAAATVVQNACLQAGRQAGCRLLWTMAASSNCNVPHPTCPIIPSPACFAGPGGLVLVAALQLHSSRPGGRASGAAAPLAARCSGRDCRP